MMTDYFTAAIDFREILCYNNKNRRIFCLKHSEKEKNMIDIEDKSYQPTVSEMSEFVGNPLFDELCGYMESEYQACEKVEYSGEKAFLGWNLKFRKAGRTLCTVYPRKGYFPMLLIVGRKEKDRVEALLPSMSEEFTQLYENTRECMNQRWLMLDFSEKNALFSDALSIVKIRRESK